VSLVRVPIVGSAAETLKLIFNQSPAIVSTRFRQLINALNSSSVTPTPGVKQIFVMRHDRPTPSTNRSWSGMASHPRADTSPMFI
jgi:hypothetical protein